MAVARIALGIQDKLFLGNLNSKRDWGHAKDYVRMMWMILQHDSAEDWVIATGETILYRDFVKMSFENWELQLNLEESGINETAFVKSCDNLDYQVEIGKEILSVDKRYFRPTEVDLLVGDASKSKKSSWMGTKIYFKRLSERNDMVRY